MSKETKWQYILIELVHHLPFTIFGVTFGLIIMGFLTFFAVLLQADTHLSLASEELFHILHPSHIIFSAIATTAMFWKHEKKLIKAVLVGFLGSIAICGISDIFFPFWGGLILGADMHFHICIIQEPGIVFPFAVIGVLAGLTVSKSFERSTEFSHSAHVFISSMASILLIANTLSTPIIQSNFIINPNSDLEKNLLFRS